MKGLSLSSLPLVLGCSNLILPSYLPIMAILQSHLLSTPMRLQKELFILPVTGLSRNSKKQKKQTKTLLRMD